MTDQTLIRHAKLYKRYKEAVAAVGDKSRYYPQYYFMDKAADREYAMNSARKIINTIRNNPEIKRQIERIIAEELNDQK